MFGWIATGEAPENHPAVFIPIHLLHLAVFLVLAWASAGYLGLVLGAFLVGYMSYFVGCYAVASAHPLLGAVAAWVPWSVLRVFAFVLLGCLFARPLLVRRAWPFARSGVPVDGARGERAPRRHPHEEPPGAELRPLPPPAGAERRARPLIRYTRQP